MEAENGKNSISSGRAYRTRGLTVGGHFSIMFALTYPDSTAPEISERGQGIVASQRSASKQPEAILARLK